MLWNRQLGNCICRDIRRNVRARWRSVLTKRNIFYRTDDMKTPMVDVMLGTFYPPDPIKIGAHMIVYALRALGVAPESEAMQTGYEVLNRHRLENGRYILTASKSVPAFKAGDVGEANKWVTLYASMAMK